jgi:hypothetical protein
MADRSSPVSDNPFGTDAGQGVVAPQLEPTGPVQEHADPGAWGSVGGAVQRFGNTAEDLAQKYGQIASETAMTNADANYTLKAAKIKGDFQQLTGMEAFNALPKATADLQAAWQDSRQGLPIGAQHGFDMMTARTNAAHIGDMSSWATGQLKQARIDSNSNMQSANMQALLDPSVAIDPQRSQYHIDSIAYGEQAKIDEDHPGLKTNPDTGVVSFDGSKPEGQQLKQSYEKNVDTIVSQAQVTRFNTLSQPGVMGVLPAYDLYQQTRSNLPKQAQVSLDSSFAPKVFQAHADNVANATLSDAAQAHANLLYNPQSQQTENAPLSVRNNNPGNLRDPSTGQFKVFSTPEDGAKAMQDDLAIKIGGNSPAMERNFGKGYSPTLSNVIATWAPASDKNDPKAYTATVSKETGIGPDQVLTAGDIAKLIPAMAKVESGTSSGRSGTTIQGPIETAAYTTTQPRYGTNAVGAPLSQADYFQTHSADVYAKGDAYAEQTMPGNLEFKQKVRSSLQQTMQTAISNQAASYKQDNSLIMRAFNGDFSNGKHPTSLDELNAIPNIKPVLDRASINSPDFVRELDSRLLTAASRGDSKDAKEYGDKIYDYQKRLTLPDGDPNKLTNPVEVMKGVGDGLTLAGQDYLLKKMQKDPVELQQENAVLAAGKNMMGVTKDDDTQWPSALVAVNKLDAELQAKGVPASERYSGIDNKNSVLHAITPFIPTDIEQARQILNQTTSSWVPAGIPTPSRLISHLTGSDKTTDFEKNFRDAMDNKTVTPQSAEKVLGEALVNKTISRETAVALHKKYLSKNATANQ